jgi:hypothetical protein
MRRDSIGQILSYVFVAILAVAMAFLISLKFLKRSHSQEATPPAQPKNVAPQESAAAVAAEVQGFLEPFLYDSKNRRDPFQPFQDFRPIETQQVLFPLQRWDVDEFHLVGVMWDIQVKVAPQFSMNGNESIALNIFTITQRLSQRQVKGMILFELDIILHTIYDIHYQDVYCSVLL